MAEAKECVLDSGRGREGEGEPWAKDLRYTLETAPTKSLSDETRDRVVIVRGDERADTFSPQDTGTQIGSRSSSSDTTSLPNRNTRIRLVHTLP